MKSPQHVARVFNKPVQFKTVVPPGFEAISIESDFSFSLAIQAIQQIIRPLASSNSKLVTNFKLQWNMQPQQSSLSEDFQFFSNQFDSASLNYSQTYSLAFILTLVVIATFGTSTNAIQPRLKTF